MLSLFIQAKVRCSCAETAVRLKIRFQLKLMVMVMVAVVPCLLPSLYETHIWHTGEESDV